MGLQERLKELRCAKNITQKQLSIDMGISERGLQNYEIGQRTPTLEIAVALAEYFGVSVEYLVGKEKDPQNMGLTEREQELIKYFRSLDNDGQTAILRAARNEYQAQEQNGLHSRIVSSLKKQDCAEDSKVLQK